MAEAGEVDASDMEIVKMLEEDARTSFRDIAKKLKVSEGTVYNRVKRMEENRVIKGFSVRTNPMKLGKEVLSHEFVDRTSTYIVLNVVKEDLRTLV